MGTVLLTCMGLIFLKMSELETRPFWHYGDLVMGIIGLIPLCYTLTIVFFLFSMGALVHFFGEVPKEE